MAGPRGLEAGEGDRPPPSPGCGPGGGGAELEFSGTSYFKLRPSPFDVSTQPVHTSPKGPTWTHPSPSPIGGGGKIGAKTLWGECAMHALMTPPMMACHECVVHERKNHPSSTSGTTDPSHPNLLLFISDDQKVMVFDRTTPPSTPPQSKRSWCHTSSQELAGFSLLQVVDILASVWAM